MDNTKIISIDVGIKNLAYCIFQKDQCSPLLISDWNSINLINDNHVDHKCNAILESSKKGKQQECICNKNAKYFFNKDGEPDKYYCEKHAKSCKKILFTKECSPTYLKKQKIDVLVDILKKLQIPLIVGNKKPQILNDISTFYDNNALKPLSKQKTSANDVSLIEIGKSIKRELNNIPEMADVTHVLIENQISPIATRMKTIQGLLAQYFIMSNDSINIEFVSSSNKLRNMVLEKTDKNTVETSSQKYKQHKLDAVIYTRQLLEENNEFKKWLPMLDTKKKDDLADCFLQGMWYLNKGSSIKDKK
jgi:hypothetical protein